MARQRWIIREGSANSGFRYAKEDGGGVVRDASTLERIEELSVPPAWRDVHIAASPRAMLQAWGFDARGRKQYRYHESAVQRREARKYYRVRRLARELPEIRAALHHDMSHAVTDRDRVAATVVRLISKGFFRIGSERYVKENHTFGLVTLRKKHVRVEGDVLEFSFTGKGSKEQHHVVVDRAVARKVKRLLRTPGKRLFRYRDEDGGWNDLTAREVNEYIKRRTGFRYTAKDFRTWGGTLRVATVLAELGPPKSESEAKGNVLLAVRLSAAELGNTPAVCRSSYVHPILLARYLDEGETIDIEAVKKSRAKSAAGHYPEERALIRFLDRHFPERRHRVRPEMRAA
jgi:DNA topoisomerase-1